MNHVRLHKKTEDDFFRAVYCAQSSTTLTCLSKGVVRKDPLSSSNQPHSRGILHKKRGELLPFDENITTCGFEEGDILSRGTAIDAFLDYQVLSGHSHNLGQLAQFITTASTESTQEMIAEYALSNIWRLVEEGSVNKARRLFSALPANISTTSAAFKLGKILQAPNYKVDDTSSARDMSYLANWLKNNKSYTEVWVAFDAKNNFLGHNKSRRFLRDELKKTMSIKGTIFLYIS